jgi:histidinol dehydrogenase
MKILNSNNRNFYSELDKIINKRKQVNKSNLKIVEKIINNVRKNQDKALIAYERKFNNNSKIIPSKKEITQAIKLLDPKIKTAIDKTYQRVKDWHSKQKPKDIYYKDKLNNKFYYRNKAIGSVACYVPGNLPSTLIMCATPAIVSGVKRIVLCTPKINGKLNGAVYYAASVLGIKESYNLGGASAIMALAMGTPKVKSVNKIVGPGSSWVALAKKLVFLEGLCGIESMNAGPSEIICWGDSSTSPDIVASSMLAQSEHDPESLAMLLTKDKNLIKKVELSIANQIKDLPRKEIAKKSLKSNGALIYASSDKKIISIINYIAPEHIEMLQKNHKKYLNDITDAGSICIGPYSSMALSDYGPTQHTLPTAQSAKFSSGLGVREFTKQISYNELSKKGVAKLGKSGYLLSTFENLTGHSRSIKKRMEKK